jgi:hypothetical protein
LKPSVEKYLCGARVRAQILSAFKIARRVRFVATGFGSKLAVGGDHAKVLGPGLSVALLTTT